MPCVRLQILIPLSFNAKRSLQCVHVDSSSRRSGSTNSTPEMSTITNRASLIEAPRSRCPNRSIHPHSVCNRGGARQSASRIAQKKLDGVAKKLGDVGPQDISRIIRLPGSQRAYEITSYRVIHHRRPSSWCRSNSGYKGELQSRLTLKATA